MAVHTNRKSGFIVRGGARRRETRWLDAIPTAVNLAGGGSVIRFSLSAAELALRPFTVVRVRGSWFVESDQLAATEIYGGALGFAVVSDQALAIGITAVPTPITDMASDLWFVYEQQMGDFLFATAVGNGEVGKLARQFDSRAMRKVEDGQDIAIVEENSGYSFGTTSQLGFRMLIKLH